VLQPRRSPSQVGPNRSRTVGPHQVDKARHRRRPVRPYHLGKIRLARGAITGRPPVPSNRPPSRRLRAHLRAPAPRLRGLLRVSSRSSRARGANRWTAPAPGAQVVGAQHAGRRGIPRSPAGVAGLLRSRGGSFAAPFRAEALRTRRLPRTVGQPPRSDRCVAVALGGHACKSGRPFPSRRASCRRARITVKVVRPRCAAGAPL
jgi:hypothetical protein